MIYGEQAMLDERVHEALFPDAAIMLGEVHGAMLKSAHIMGKERWIPTNSKFRSTYEWTEFGNRVGQDKIHWWICENERDAYELVAITNEALEADTGLEDQLGQPKNSGPESYEALLVSLKEFNDIRDH